MIIDDLQAALPADCLVQDPDVMQTYAHDEAAWADWTLPLAVVRPRTTEQVQQVVQACVRHQVPLVPRGAGMGLSGGANASRGCVVISLERMNQIHEINRLERIAVVGPGVVNDHLRDAAAEYGLWYPPDPASSPWSSIGGNVNTNAGGLCCVKYGVTRDYVIGLEVVNGLGEIVQIGRRTAKGVAGYDLTGLFVGSEGTLGIVTQVIVKLRPLPPEPITIAGHFPSLVAAGNAIEAVAAAGITPSMLELVDKRCLQVVDDWKNMGLSVDAEVLLLGRVDEPGEQGEAQADLMVECFESSGATFAARSTDRQEAEALFAARRLAYPAMERLGLVVTEDVCVPKAQVPTMLGLIEQIGRRYGVDIANIAHAGDGNLHPLLLVPDNEPETKQRIMAAFEEILDSAIELGGTVTGEHGVGLLKRGGLGREQSPEVIEMQRAIRRALDPHGIFNPGKVLPDGR